MNNPNVGEDVSRLQARVHYLELRVQELEKKTARLGRLEAELGDLKRQLEAFGIKLRSTQEASGDF